MRQHHKSLTHISLYMCDTLTSRRSCEGLPHGRTTKPAAFRIPSGGHHAARGLELGDASTTRNRLETKEEGMRPLTVQNSLLGQEGGLQS